MKDENTISQAVARHVRMSPQKGRLVADLIRGRTVGEALTILRFSEKKKDQRDDREGPAFGHCQCPAESLQYRRRQAVHLQHHD